MGKPGTAHEHAKATGSTPLDADDGRRGSVAVIASLTRQSDGSVRLVLADARATAPGKYTEIALFTSRDYDRGALVDLALDPREFQMLGENVVARLVAASGEVRTE